MNNKLTHTHFKEGSRLPYPGERIIFCSCTNEAEIARHFNETIRLEPCQENGLGCRLRKSETR